MKRSFLEIKLLVEIKDSDFPTLPHGKDSVIDHVLERGLQTVMHLASSLVL